LRHRLEEQEQESPRKLFRAVVTSRPGGFGFVPAGWPRAQARKIFTEVYDGLAEQAQEHVCGVVMRFGLQPDADIRSHTVAEMAAGFRSGS